MSNHHQITPCAYHLNNPGGGVCEGGAAALTYPIFPYLLR
jgi:hypothetical protein